MNYFLSRDAVLKLLERPFVYNVSTDALYELDDISFAFLQECATEAGREGSDKNFIDYCLKEGILITEKASTRRPSLIKAPEPSLRYLELQVTTNCNLRCRHCYLGGRAQVCSRQWRDNELSFEKICAVLYEFEEMQGLRLIITGGEPLTHSQFSEINAVLPDLFVRSILVTNGLLLTPKMLSHLHFHEIQISIDGLEDAHDFLRGAGTFKTAMAAIRNSLDAGLPVSVSTMVHPGNLRDFDEMNKLFQEMGIREWTVDVPCITGNLKEHPECQIHPEIGGKFLTYGFGEGLHAGATGYACGTHLMAVTANGKAAKCSFYAHNPLGNIEEGLRANWQRLKPIKLESLACDCDFLSECRGGCRYRALLLGDELGKDFYRCRLYDILHSDG